MEEILRYGFTAHYGLPPCISMNFATETKESYFEVEDLPNKEISIFTSRDRGTAKFSNPDKMNLTIFNYDKFVSTLPSYFQEGRKRCDIILTCTFDRYFILGELKDRTIIRKRSESKVKKGAENQLLQTLNTLIEVPEVLDFMNTKSIKRCCYFNKQSKSPDLINAVKAFNRLPNIFPEGFQMPHPAFESLNFEFWEYTGEQTLILRLK